MFLTDPFYLSILFLSGVTSLLASVFVKARFLKASQINTQSGLNGFQIAQSILRNNKIYNVEIVEHPGFLSDHYNPINKTLVLSPEVYHGRNAASTGVAAHEVGHALQHNQHYKALWLRSALIPFITASSILGVYMLVIGLLLHSLSQFSSLGESLCFWGTLLFSGTILFSLITLPVELDASKRANRALQKTDVLSNNAEAKAVKSILIAASFTYIAAVLNPIFHLFYWLQRPFTLKKNS